MLCPVCGADEFGVSLVRDHRFGCFRQRKCGFRGTIKALISRLSIPDSVINSHSISDGGSTLFVSTEDTDKKQCVDILLPLWYEGKEKLTQRAEVDTCYEYMEKRVGVAATASIEWGWTPRYPEHIIFPVRKGGELINWNGRSLFPDVFPKYMVGYPSGASLYGVDDVVEGTSCLILVEGVFDKFKVDLWLSSRGVESTACVATLGVALTDDKIKILASTPVEEIVLWHEQDNENMSKRFYSNLCKLANHFRVSYSDFNDYDPADASLVQLDATWRQRQSSSIYFYTHLTELI